MYETLMMIKNGLSFSLDEMDCLITKIAQGGVTTYERKGQMFKLLIDSGYLEVIYNPNDYVVIESREIADHYSIPCAECKTRYEMCGHAENFDAHMDLFNEYLLINEHLNKTGKFIIFDQQEGKLMFKDENF